MYLTFYKEFRGTEHQKNHLHESPSLITFPLIVLAILSFIGGAISLPTNSWLNHYLAPLFSATSHEEHVLGTTEYALMGIALLGAIVGIGIAFAKYIKNSEIPSEDADIKGFSKVLYDKYYVDEFYTAIIVNPINSLSSFFRKYVESGISSLVFGFGQMANSLANAGKRVQNGSIGLYLFAFVIGVSAILFYLFLAQ